MDRYSTVGFLSGNTDLKALGEAISSSQSCSKFAATVKIEAMITQATKAKVKKTQRDLAAAQLSEIAGSEDIVETDLEPHLLTFAKEALS